MTAPTIPGLENSTPTHEPPQRKYKRGTKATLLGLALVLPNLILLLVFTYRPLIDNIRLSFYNWNIASTRPATFVGLDNYIEWAQNPVSWQIVLQTAIFTVAPMVR